MDLNNLLKNPMKFVKDINMLKETINILDDENLQMESSMESNKLKYLNDIMPTIEITQEKYSNELSVILGLTGTNKTKKELENLTGKFIYLLTKHIWCLYLTGKISFDKLKAIYSSLFDINIDEEKEYNLYQINSRKVGNKYSYGYGYGYGYSYGYDDNNNNINTDYFTNKKSTTRLFSPKRIDFKPTQLGGMSLSETTIINFDTVNLKNANLYSQDLNIIFLDSKNKNEINSNKYFRRGGTTAIYRVKIQTTATSPYNNEVLIMRLLEKSSTDIDNYLDKFIKKYDKDLNISNETKKYFIDILFYGSITKNGKSFAYFIVPEYSTEALLENKLSALEKKLSLENTIKMLQSFNRKNKYIDDLKIVNISIDNNLEPVLIDYDIGTLVDGPVNVDKIASEFIHPYYKDPTNKNKLDKIYNTLLSEMIYQYYYLGTYGKNTIEIKDDFNTLFTHKPDKFKIVKKPDNNTILDELNKKSVFLGQGNILYDITTGRGLLAQTYDDILSLDEVLLKIKTIMDKPTPNTYFSPTSVARFNSYLEPGSNFIVSEWGFGIKNFENQNLYKFDITTPENFSLFDKLRQNHYYFRINKWDIKYYNDDSEAAGDVTLQYALQSVGCIHTVKFNGKGNPPEYVLHLNKDFKTQYGGYFDNCRFLEKATWTLIFWISEITNLFNLIAEKYNLTKTIYLNIHDHPINKGQHPIGTDISKHPFPDMKLHTDTIKIPINATPTDIIYCWAPKKIYKDVGLPFHDVWMHLFSYWFSHDFNIDNYKLNEWVTKPLSDKKGQAFFRGSYTNCSYPIEKSVRLISHLRTLEGKTGNTEGLINSYVVGGPTTFAYQHFDLTKLTNDIDPLEDWLKTAKYYAANLQPEFRYILNLDGFASAFRVIKEMYYNSILIIPESPFNDVVRDILVPWKHYVPVKEDLSNLENIIKWCNSNLSQMNIILNNMTELRDKIITIDNMLDLAFRKVSTNDNNTSLNFKLTDGIFDTSTQSKITEPTVSDDTITKLGKETTFKWVDEKGDIKRQETIYYKKYLKYKEKYLKLKSELEK